MNPLNCVRLKFNFKFVLCVLLVFSTVTIHIFKPFKSESMRVSRVEFINRGDERVWEIENNQTENPVSQFFLHALSSDSGGQVESLWAPPDFLTDSLQGEVTKYSDRILEQLLWQMGYSHNQYFNRSLTMKKLLLWEGYNWWSKNSWKSDETNGLKVLQQSDCPGTPNSITKCSFTDNQKDLENVDAVIFVKDAGHQSIVNVPENILKFYFNLESPFNSKVQLHNAQDLLATYWRGSHLVTPYAKWAYYDTKIKAKPQEKNYFSGKEKAVAIFLSNCFAQNQRLEYIRELQQYIQVDVYGRCGNVTCTKSSDATCFKMLKNEYFFYLSFENSNCRDYITEKFFMNALLNDVVPIGYGAHPDDYRAVAPLNSYIHVEDFAGPKQLAVHLKFLMENPVEYNKYFEWKGTGEFVQSDLLCRMCAMVHYADFKVPPAREKPFLWSRLDSVEQGMCLNKERRYWTIPKN